MIIIRSIDSIALGIATHIKSVVPQHPASVPVIKHGVSVAINTVSISVLTIVIAVWSGRLLETIQAMVAFALLRRIVGGYHIKSNSACIMVSTAMLTTLSYASISYTWVVILSILSIVLIFIYAPSRIKGKTRIKETDFPKLRVLGILVVALNLWLALPIVAASFFVQSLTLIRGGDHLEKTVHQS